MRDDFSVGLAGEFRALLLEHFAQLAEILDDAVVNHRDVVGRVGVRVVLGRLAMRGPARVADTAMAGQRRCLEFGFEIPELAFGAAPIEMIAFQRRNAGGIVAAIFKALE